MRAMLLMGVRLVEAAARVVAGLSWPSTRSERLSFALRASSGSVGLVTVLTISGVLALLMISNLLLGIDVKREEVFDPYLSQYTHIVEYAESHQMVSEYSQCKYKHGKILVFNGAHVAGLHFELPIGMRAEAPEDVGTIAIVKDGKEVVGYYGGNKENPGYRSYLKIELIDVPTMTIVGKGVLWGSGPPLSKTSNESEYGALSLEKIVAWFAHPRC